MPVPFLSQFGASRLIQQLRLHSSGLTMVGFRCIRFFHSLKQVLVRTPCSSQCPFVVWRKDHGIRQVQPQLLVSWHLVGEC